MGTLTNLLAGLAQGVLNSLTASSKGRQGTSSGTRPRLKPQPRRPKSVPAPVPLPSEDLEHGRMPGAETVAVNPDRIRDVRITYAPDRDGDPDAGEVIWTWVPYEENDGRGKDRPVLVIGRHTIDRVYAVRMTSSGREGDRDYIGIGSGDWDSKGRPSWVDIDQLYSVHVTGMRREAAVLDRRRYAVVAEALVRRYGWAVGE